MRDLGDSLCFTRALDLFAALHLHEIERPHFFKSDDAFRCVTVELLRRAGKVGLVWAPLKPSASRQIGYRKELSRATRLEVYRLLFTGLGQAAVALARNEAKRAEEQQQTENAYHAAVSAIAAEYEGDFTPDPAIINQS